MLSVGSSGQSAGAGRSVPLTCVDGLGVAHWFVQISRNVTYT
ncbi:hypothetical protein [Photobacterium damselae]|nr:hypothetical protein [Photobacterium damselae]